MITTKQRAFLRKMVHDMDPIFQVGKSGVTPEMIKAIDDALEARELIKLSVLENCEYTAREVADALSEETGSEVVAVLGRKLVLYRESEKHKKIEL